MSTVYRLTSALACLAAAQMAGPGGSPQGLPSAVFEKTGCIIHPLRQVVVSSQASGVIVAMPVEEGDVLKAGQLIAQLDETVARLTVERLRLIVGEEQTVGEAKIRLEQAEEDYQTAKSLAGSVARAEVEAARRRYELAKVILQRAEYQRALARIELDQAEKRLGDHRIRAPIDGVVLKKHREAGESVDADVQTPVVTLIDVSKLRVEVLIPVEWITAVRLDQRARVTCEVFPDRPIDGRVVFIGPVIHADVNEFTAKVEFTDPAGLIRPGMRATVNIGRQPSEMVIGRGHRDESRTKVVPRNPMTLPL